MDATIMTPAGVCPLCGEWKEECTVLMDDETGKSLFVCVDCAREAESRDELIERLRDAGAEKAGR